jgi:hypothetical protein
VVMVRRSRMVVVLRAGEKDERNEEGEEEPRGKTGRGGGTSHGERAGDAC